MRKLLLSGLTLLALASVAHSKELRMPDVFIGEWCANGGDKNEKDFQLPSWMGDEPCKDIFAVTPWDFGPDGSTSCQPMKVQLTHDTAPSGTEYSAKIYARCDGTIQGNVTFELSRYKGSLTVKQH